MATTPSAYTFACTFLAYYRVLPDLLRREHCCNAT